MRTKNSFFNFIANEGSHLLNVILSFLAQTVFIHALSQEYQGVGSLFSNILTVLSLAELGIGMAMIFHIYKPVAEEDYALQQQLMNMYRRLYTVVAAVVAVLGLALVPFLEYLITDNQGIPWDRVRLIYLLYLCNAVSTYFFSYRRALIDAHQKQYINTILNTVFTTVQFLGQIVVLLLFHNFVAYLLVQIACNITCNLIGAKLADRMYPYLKEDRKSLPPKEVRQSIFRNLRATFLHRVGSVVVNDTDNLILSAFVGIRSVAVYSNYQRLQYAIVVLMNGLFGSFTASIGNLGALGNKERTYEVYRMLNFLMFLIDGFAAVCFIVLYNPFIRVWVSWAGKNPDDYLWPWYIVLIIVVNFYISMYRTVTLNFRDALGLYWYDRYKPIFEVIINLTASLYLVNRIGTFGIFAGTLISTLSTSFWVEPYVTYKHGFERPVGEFFASYAKYAATVVGVGGFTYWVAGHLTMGGMTEVIGKLAVCIVVYGGIVFLLYHRTKLFRALWAQLRVLLEGLRQRRA